MKIFAFSTLLSAQSFSFSSSTSAIPGSTSFLKSFYFVNSVYHSASGFSVVFSLSTGLAIHVYDAKYSITNLEGEIGPEYPMASTAVYVKRDGEWKILHYHQSWRTNLVEKQEAE